MSEKTVTVGQYRRSRRLDPYMRPKRRPGKPKLVKGSFRPGHVAGYKRRPPKPHTRTSKAQMAVLRAFTSKKYISQSTVTPSGEVKSKWIKLRWVFCVKCFKTPWVPPPMKVSQKIVPLLGAKTPTRSGSTEHCGGPVVWKWINVQYCFFHNWQSAWSSLCSVWLFLFLTKTAARSVGTVLWSLSWWEYGCLSPSFVIDTFYDLDNT